MPGKEPTLADVDRYLKLKAMADRPGTPAEGEAFAAKVRALVEEYPTLPAVAARVSAAMNGAEPPIGDCPEWLKEQVGGQPPAPAGGVGFPWLERLARGFGAGMVAATRALDEEAADGGPLAPGQMDVRIQRLPSRDEVVIRVRMRARSARKLRREVGRRVSAELDAFLGPS